MSELCDLPAVDLRARIARREITAAELLASCEKRIAETNPFLNAFVETRFDEAREAAAAADRAVAEGRPLGLLHGLPCGVKESSDIAGYRTTHGSPLYADRWAKTDDSMVAAVRAEGAVILGKTNVPELLHGMTTNNTLFGLTRNPHDPALTCQGSSGGAAVSLAASMVPISTGSDTGGSIRGPAATNGVFGLRPTPGLIGREDSGHVFNPSSVLGPMARNAGDLALLLAAMIHENRHDPFFWSLPKEQVAAVRPVDLSRLRVAITPDLGVVDVDPAIRDAFEDKVRRVVGRFGKVEWTSPDLGEIVRAFWWMRPLKFMLSMGAAYKADPHCMTEYKRLDMRRGYALSAEQIVWAMGEQGRAYRAMIDFFRDFDVLITPGWASLPLSLKEIELREAAMAKANAAAGPFEFDFSVPDTARIMNPPVTLTAHPVLTMPAGRGPTGQPFAFNMIGPYRGDLGLLAIARALEPVFEADEALARPLPDFAAIDRWSADAAA